MPTFPKQTPIKRTDYTQFLDEVRSRDMWRCRRCERRSQLQVHHIIKRSHRRLDTLENAITLCAACHAAIEAHRVVILGDTPVNANGIVRFREVP